MVRFVPIERLNAVLVLTQQPRYLDEVRNWIARLDRSQNLSGRQLFVYYVQNGKADDLAKTLGSVFMPGKGGAVLATVSVAESASPALGTSGTTDTAVPAGGAGGLSASPAAAALRRAGNDGVQTWIAEVGPPVEFG